MKFNLVGAFGIVVQLGVLWMLTGMGVHYMLATPLAVEAAVLHNFLWHERFTWADRNRGQSRERGLRRLRLFRFHMSNGAVSIGGNLLLMRLLVGEAHMRAVVANLISIAGCSVVNYLVSDRWVFRAEFWPVSALAVEDANSLDEKG
jgi:putative flippase GtrA